MVLDPALVCSYRNTCSQESWSSCRTRNRNSVKLLRSAGSLGMRTSQRTWSPELQPFRRRPHGRHALRQLLWGCRLCMYLFPRSCQMNSQSPHRCMCRWRVFAHRSALQCKSSRKLRSGIPQLSLLRPDRREPGRSRTGLSTECRRKLVSRICDCANVGNPSLFLFLMLPATLTVSIHGLVWILIKLQAYTPHNEISAMCLTGETAKGAKNNAGNRPDSSLKSGILSSPGVSAG